MSATNPHFETPEIPELAVLRAALEWAKTQRIRIEPTAPPLECVSSHASTRWVRRDPDAVVDPIGAAILRRQPGATTLMEAAAEALASRVPCVEGLRDGLAGDPPAQAWALSTAKRLYLPAYLAGVQLRAEMSTFVCFAHQLRVPRGQHCPSCLRGLS